jgi:transketolase
MSLRAQFAKTVHELSQYDDSLVVVVGDISHGIFKPFAQEFPKRYFNIGICEPGMVSVCAGLSKLGLNPVVHTIAPFLIERSFEQIKLDFEYQQESGNFVSVGGTFDYSQLGCSHHCYSDVSMIKQLPSSRIFLPGSPNEFDQIFRENYNKPGIKYYRLTENPHGFVLPENKQLPEGTLVRRGQDLTIVTTGSQLKTASRVCDLLAENQINADLVYLPQVWPFDASLVRASCRKSKNLFVVSELNEIGGLFDQCLKETTDLNLDLTNGYEIKGFIREYGSYEELCSLAGLDAEKIYTSIKSFF